MKKYFLILLFMFVPSVLSLTIIPDNPFENKTLDLCSQIYNSSNSNKTLDCVNYFISLESKNSTVIINNTNDFISYLHNQSYARRDWVLNQIKNENYLTPDKITLLVQEKVDLAFKEKEKLFDDKINSINISAAQNKEFDRLQEYRMEALKQGIIIGPNGLPVDVKDQQKEEQSTDKEVVPVTQPDPNRQPVYQVRESFFDKYSFIFFLIVFLVVAVYVFVKRDDIMTKLNLQSSHTVKKQTVPPFMYNREENKDKNENEKTDNRFQQLSENQTDNFFEEGN